MDCNHCLNHKFWRTLFGAGDDFGIGREMAFGTPLGGIGIRGGPQARCTKKRETGLTGMDV